MYGAIIGDIVGSIYERNNIKTKNFDLFSNRCSFTDDTVMTCAVASALILQKKRTNDQNQQQLFVAEMQKLGRKYPHAGYGGNFIQWLMLDDPKPYGSYGNGSAMRVSPVGWAAKTLDAALLTARYSAEVSHNHPEGIKGAQAVAAAIFMARAKKSKQDIKEYIETKFYDLSFSLEEIRPRYSFDVSCQGSVPQAIAAFLEAENFEDSIRNAISIGGDSDTIAAIAGSIAEAFYGVPDPVQKKALQYLDHELLCIIREFRSLYELN